MSEVFGKKKAVFPRNVLEKKLISLEKVRECETTSAVTTV